MQVKFISTIQPIQMTPTKVINSISLNMQVIRIIQESIISNATSTSTRAIYLSFSSIFFCECCHAIILIFLFSNFTLNLRNPAATRGVSPSCILFNRDQPSYQLQLKGYLMGTVHLPLCNYTFLPLNDYIPRTFQRYTVIFPLTLLTAQHTLWACSSC